MQMRILITGKKGNKKMELHFGQHQYVYPFSAIVGQEQMKKGLLLNVINPKIGGVLIFGEKGTAKSTAVRALAELLPEIEVVKGCQFRCDPNDPSTMCDECREKLERGETLDTEMVKMRVIDLPVSATEDRVVGSLDIEEAIRNGKKKFEPGVLARANRGILYVDEVNLLDDHIVDLLLDSAAMGVNTVEREGISYSHPANFILVGTMNPEEGELRPQLLDRFGISVNIHGINDPEKRVEIVTLRGEFEDDPEAFCKRFEPQQEELRRQIVKAKELLSKVEMDRELLVMDAMIAIELSIDGHRGELTMMKAARANAALAGRWGVVKEDIKEIVEMTLLHRLKNLPFEKIRQLDLDSIYDLIDTFGKKQASGMGESSRRKEEA